MKNMFVCEILNYVPVSLFTQECNPVTKSTGFWNPGPSGVYLLDMQYLPAQCQSNINELKLDSSFTIIIYQLENAVMAGAANILKLVSLTTQGRMPPL